MTCIVGVVEKGKVYMASDSFSGNYTSMLKETSPKLFRNGCLLFGVSGSWRLNHILNHSLSFQKNKPKDPKDFIINQVIPEIQVESEAIRSEEMVSIDILIACNGRLFGIQDDLALMENPDGFMSSGSGWGFAMATLELSKLLPPKPRLQKALEITEKFCPIVKAPFHFMEM